jgi:lantibiotic biosynthesis protein
MICKVAILKDICVHLDQIENTAQEDGLNGNAGLVLFYFYFYRYSKNELYYNKAVRILENIFERIDGNYSNSNFFDGISGIGWLLEHIVDNNFIEIDCDSLFGDTIDEHIHQGMLRDLYQDNFAFDDGALGKCFYFIKRYRNTKCNLLKLKYRNYITELILFIERQKIYENYNKPIASQGDKVYFSNSTRTSQNIWMVNILLHICSLREFDILVLPLLEKYSEYLSEKIKLNSFKKAEIALSLWRSGKVLNKRSSLEKAEKILQHKMFDTDLEIMNYYKSGIIFKEMFENVNHDIYKELKEQCISMGLQELSIIGFQKLDIGIWNGLSGIGLSLLTFENNTKTNWQECFLYK